MPPDEILKALNKIDTRLSVLETHMETMAVNQMNLSCDFKGFQQEYDKEQKDIEHRITSVETRSGLIAIVITSIGGFFGWLIGK